MYDEERDREGMRNELVHRGIIALRSFVVLYDIYSIVSYDTIL